MQFVWGIGGIVVLLGLALAMSTNRRAINLRTVGVALAIEVLFAVLVLYWDTGADALTGAANGVQQVINAANAGIDFLFGGLLTAVPDDEEPVFAIQVLPIIVYFAALMSMLYHLGVLQAVVRVLGGGLRWLLGTSRPESLSVTADIFVGPTEAPLVVRPYIARMTDSELFAVMTGGLTTVAGSVLVGYSLLGAPLDYLIAASFMAAPASLLMAKIVLPETQESPAEREAARGRGRALGPRANPGNPDTPADEREHADHAGAAEEGEEGKLAPTDEDEEEVEFAEGARNIIDAIARGALEGLRLALNVGALLIAFISLIGLANLVLGAVGGLFGNPDLTFQSVLGYVFAPLAFVIGIPWEEAVQAGGLLGIKLVLNEFVAFAQFGPSIAQYSDKTVAVMTFALAGFANFGTIGILLGGIGGMAPNRRGDIARLGLRAVFAASLANLLNGTLAGMLIG